MLPLKQGMLLQTDDYMEANCCLWGKLLKANFPCLPVQASRKVIERWGCFENDKLQHPTVRL